MYVVLGPLSFSEASLRGHSTVLKVYRVAVKLIGDDLEVGLLTGLGRDVGTETVTVLVVRIVTWSRDIGLVDRIVLEIEFHDTTVGNLRHFLPREFVTRQGNDHHLIDGKFSAKLLVHRLLVHGLGAAAILSARVVSGSAQCP